MNKIIVDQISLGEKAHTVELRTVDQATIAKINFFPNGRSKFPLHKQSVNPWGATK